MMNSNTKTWLEYNQRTNSGEDTVQYTNMFFFFTPALVYKQVPIKCYLYACACFKRGD